MALSWTKIELSKLIKDFDIENQARIDGSNNVPLTESNQHSPTETRNSWFYYPALQG